MVKVNLRYEINNNCSKYNIFGYKINYDYDNYYDYYCNYGNDYYVYYYTNIIHNYNDRKESIKINNNRSQDKKEDSGRQYSNF